MRRKLEKLRRELAGKWHEYSSFMKKLLEMLLEADDSMLSDADLDFLDEEEEEEQDGFGNNARKKQIFSKFGKSGNKKIVYLDDLRRSNAFEGLTLNKILGAVLCAVMLILSHYPVIAGIYEETIYDFSRSDEISVRICFWTGIFLVLLFYLDSGNPKRTLLGVIYQALPLVMVYFYQKLPWVYFDNVRFLRNYYVMWACLALTAAAGFLPGIRLRGEKKYIYQWQEKKQETFFSSWPARLVSFGFRIYLLILFVLMALKIWVLFEMR